MSGVIGVRCILISLIRVLIKDYVALIFIMPLTFEKLVGLRNSVVENASREQSKLKFNRLLYLSSLVSNLA